MLVGQAAHVEELMSSGQEKSGNLQSLKLQRRRKSFVCRMSSVTDSISMFDIALFISMLLMSKLDDFHVFSNCVQQMN